MQAEELQLLIIRPGLAAEMRYAPDDRLETMRGILGGHPDAIGPSADEPNKWMGFVDEEGLRKNLPVNLCATHVAAGCGWDWWQAAGGVLRGTAVFLGVAGEQDDVPLSLMERAADYHAHSGVWRSRQRVAAWFAAHQRLLPAGVRRRLPTRWVVGASRVDWVEMQRRKRADPHAPHPVYGWPMCPETYGAMPGDEWTCPECGRRRVAHAQDDGGLLWSVDPSTDPARGT